MAEESLQNLDTELDAQGNKKILHTKIQIE